jgi:hypothetical protein
MIFISCSSGPPKKGWVCLFNGENLDGWTIDCETRDEGKNYWTVEDGMICVNSMGDPDHGYVWLSTEKEYGDFELKLKFAAFKESPGNSGIQVRSRYDRDTLYLDGPQVDINPPAAWRTGMVYDETRGYRRWIFPDLPKGEWVDEGMVLNPAEFYYSDRELAWNKLRIRAEGVDLQAWLNGVQVTDLKGEGILNDSIHQHFKVSEKGVIALQLHVGDELKMYYKDLYIREL